MRVYSFGWHGFCLCEVTELISGRCPAGRWNQLKLEETESWRGDGCPDESKIQISTETPGFVRNSLAGSAAKAMHTNNKKIPLGSINI